MKLIISSKAYSPWPLRAWLLMRVLDIPFEEEVIDVSAPDKKARLAAASPTGRVPVLIDGAVRVWESTAIIEHLAERFPERAIWPRDAAARAHARSAAHEMHSGFAALRKRFPFNTRRPPRAVALDATVQAEIARVVALWSEALNRFGGEGRFLYGPFCAADAMYAPLALRFKSYAVEPPGPAGAYMKRVLALPALVEWTDAAMADPARNPAVDSAE